MEINVKPAFLFDLDGTLVDSVYQHVLAWRAHRNERGIVYERPSAGDRTSGDRRGGGSAATDAQTGVSASGEAGSPAPRRAGTPGLPVAGRGAVGHRDQRTTGDRSPCAGHSWARARSASDHAGPGAACQAGP